jgi:hypothetical protein
MIINITPNTFGPYGIRNGDMIAIINVLQWLRQKHNNPDIKFWMPPNYIIKDTGYHEQFFDYLNTHWDFFSPHPNPERNFLPYEHIMLWDFRDNIGDIIQIPNGLTTQKKVVICPVLDAKYNTMRNWPEWIMAEVVNKVNTYKGYEKIICVHESLKKQVMKYGLEVSTDFETNLNHIRTAEVFVGGDTGTSHFASALKDGPNELVYLYSARSVMHSLPFHSVFSHVGRKGTIVTYSTQYKMELF